MDKTEYFLVNGIGITAASGLLCAGGGIVVMGSNASIPIATFSMPEIWNLILAVSGVGVILATFLFTGKIIRESSVSTGWLVAALEYMSACTVLGFLTPTTAIKLPTEGILFLLVIIMALSYGCEKYIKYLGDILDDTLNHPLTALEMSEKEKADATRLPHDTDNPDHDGLYTDV